MSMIDKHNKENVPMNTSKEITTVSSGQIHEEKKAARKYADRMSNLPDHCDPLPPWAEDFAYGHYIQKGAMLHTRDESVVSDCVVTRTYGCNSGADVVTMNGIHLKKLKAEDMEQLFKAPRHLVKDIPEVKFGTDE